MAPGHAANADEHNHRKIDHELRDMISTLTHHLTGLGKDGGGGSTGDRSLGMVMLAGSNKGAVMKADLLDEAAEYGTDHHHHGSEKKGVDESKLSAYANSNYQAVNNSIMIDGKCEAEDPGVHIEIVDCFQGPEEEEDDDDEDEHEKDEKKKKEKKKDEKKEKKKKKEKDGSDDDEKRTERKDRKGSVSE